MALYIGNGHAAWEASIANLLAPGDKALFLVTGRFGAGWAQTARQMGVDVEVIDFGFSDTVDGARVAERLAADRAGAIRMVWRRPDRHGLLGPERRADGTGGARRGRASGAPRRRLHREPRLATASRWTRWAPT